MDITQKIWIRWSKHDRRSETLSVTINPINVIKGLMTVNQNFL